MPYNFVCVQAGLMITEMQSLDDLWSRSTVLRLLCIAALSLLPTALKVWCLGACRLRVRTGVCCAEIRHGKVTCVRICFAGEGVRSAVARIFELVEQAIAFWLRLCLSAFHPCA